MCTDEIPSRLWVAVHLLASVWITDVHPWIPSRMWVAVRLLASISVVDLQPCNPFQAVSCSSGPHLICWLAPCTYEFPSSGWVIVRLHFSRWRAAMQPLSGCELLFWPSFDSLTCTHEFPSSWWVAVRLPPLLESLTCSDEIPSSLWVSVRHPIRWRAAMNSLQYVSCCASWPFESLTCTQSVSCCASWPPFELLTCNHVIPSRALVTLLVFILFTNFHPFQSVSCYPPPGPHSIHWRAPLNSLPECELLSTSSWDSLTYTLLACELLCAPWSPFQSLTYRHEFPSRKWVSRHILHWPEFLTCRHHTSLYIPLSPFILLC